ncbi:MAG: YefM protein (antitoxin to YoeB) [uncultured Sulfurovum sp.]|uniref:Antitoxin n=1 Tax=uncultured Sulfurovum sp. TaxID=269237 RepID=A0A6S6RY36_9BACT|nr:MAG: YefM protein (antitoxin to YoeB) [uncultured Sulfurovum sp.]
MTVINYTEARNNLKNVLDSVVEDADYTIINRRDAEDAVVMSLDYFNAMQETLHLLRSPKNVAHLEKSIAQYQASKVESHRLINE